MNEMRFQNRKEFRDWLRENAGSTQGIWLVLSKKRPPDTIKAGEALEEALCFGWIDGQIQSVDETAYLKYFKQRSVRSRWSEKNKKMVEELEAKQLMTDFGRAKVEEAKRNGLWETQPPARLTEEQMRQFEEMLRPYQIACENFLGMTPSVRKAYAGSYFFGAKTEQGRQKRFETIVGRLNLNLNPMESLKKKREDPREEEIEGQTP